MLFTILEVFDECYAAFLVLDLNLLVLVVAVVLVGATYPETVVEIVTPG